MNAYLHNLLVYFENVLHPAGGSSDIDADKRKRKSRKPGSLQLSPESFNIRGGVAKKQEKLSSNPTP